VLHGEVFDFVLQSADSEFYPGIARTPGTFGTPDPKDPAKLVLTTSHPAPYTRRVAVYIPRQYIPGTAAPFIVGADGPDPLLFTTLDALIAQHRVPPMISPTKTWHASFRGRGITTSSCSPAIRATRTSAVKKQTLPEALE